MFENSVTFLAVANVANALTDGTSVVTNLPAGSAGVFREIGDVFERTASIKSDSGYFYIGWKDANGQIHKSPRFQGTKVGIATSKAHAVRTEQVSYIGYNGVSGDIAVNNSAYYGIRLVLNHTFGMLNNSPLMKTIPYKSDASATAAEIALGLIHAGEKSFARGVNQDVKFSLIAGQAVNADYDISHDITVVNGSATINVATNLTYNTSGGTLAVGDFIRFAPTLNGTLSLTSSVYKVIAINTLAVTLDRPIEEPSGTWTDAGDGNQVITAAQAGSADFGIKLTGSSVADADFNPVTDVPYVVNFKITLSDEFDSTPITDSTKPSVGIGSYQLVSALEARTQFEDRPRTIQAYPPTVRRIDATAGVTYEVLSVEIVDDAFVSATSGVNPKSPANLLIASKTALTTDIADYVTVFAAENLA